MVIDVYGSSGDYLGSGIDGLEITVHGNAQDQLGQIIKRGKMVIHGDVGQTFMYGAKGGVVYVLGNAAGRPLINSVGRPKVVINGTCLDFLAESFMAGDPHTGGGFVILNGVKFDDDGKLVPLAEPYPGSNLFSLASGGAIFVRDPQKTHGGPAVERRQIRQADRRRLGIDPAVPGGERETFRDNRRAAFDRERQTAQAEPGVSQGCPRQRQEHCGRRTPTMSGRRKPRKSWP